MLGVGLMAGDAVRCLRQGGIRVMVVVMAHSVNDHNLAVGLDHTNILGHCHGCVVVVPCNHERP